LEPDHVHHERRARAVQLLRDDALALVRIAAAAVLDRPVEPQVAGFVDLALPLAQELELLVRLDLEEALGELEARMRRLVRLDPGPDLAPELGVLARLALLVGSRHRTSLGRRARRASGAEASHGTPGARVRSALVHSAPLRPPCAMLLPPRPASGVGLWAAGETGGGGGGLRGGELWRVMSAIW